MERLDVAWVESGVWCKGREGPRSPENASDVGRGGKRPWYWMSG